MKRHLSFLLVLVLIAGLLSVGASAADAKVMISRQNLRADGVTVACEKYNIDGSNYFKLRDIAFLVNGTGSQFSVGYDSAKKVVSIVTGEEYDPNGSEMDVSGGDKSGTAVPSTQTILIDGAERSDLSVYNIGGNNYFKLRDLGTALGFKVDYDSASNTAIIISRRAAYPVDYLIQETWITTSDGSENHSVTTYNEDGRVISSYEAGESYESTSTFEYDELGRETKRSHVNVWDGETTYSSSTTTYDIWGNLVREVYEETGDIITEYLYTYDAYGNQLSYTYRSNYGETTAAYTYDADGNILRSVTTYDDGTSSGVEYIRDALGNTLKERGFNSAGETTYTEEYTRDAQGRTLKSIYTNSDGSTSVYTYTYDAKGNLTRSEYTSDTYGSMITENRYDKGGRLVRTETTGDYGGSFTSYLYDDQDRLIRTEYSNYEDYHWISETFFDDQGRIARDTYDEDGILRETVYSYDEALRKMTARTVITYPKAESIFLGDSSLLLPAGDRYDLYYYFEPSSAAYEETTWSSSDPDVAQVDEYGTVTAVSEGEAVITVTSESGLTASCTVTVAGQKFTLTVDPGSQTVGIDKTKPFHCTIEHIGEWQSSRIYAGNYRNDVISVSWDDWYYEDGLEMITLYVKGLAVGTSTIDIYLTHDDVFTGELVTVTVTVTG